jgi:hypothetical protein
MAERGRMALTSQEGCGQEQLLEEMNVICQLLREKQRYHYMVERKLAEG